MKQHRLIFLQTVSFCFSLLAMSLDGFSQKPSAVPLDSLITVGYATGNIKNLSGSVEKITELQMNRDQILNPLDAIRGQCSRTYHTKRNKRSRPHFGCRPPLRGTTSLYQWHRAFDYCDDGVFPVI